MSHLYSSTFTPVIEYVLILWSILIQFPHSSHIDVPLHLKQRNTEDIINILHLQFQLSARSWCHSRSASSVPFVSPCSDKSTTVKRALVDWAAARLCSPWRLQHKEPAQNECLFRCPAARGFSVLLHSVSLRGLVISLGYLCTWKIPRPSSFTVTPHYSKPEKGMKDKKQESHVPAHVSPCPSTNCPLCPL